MAEHTATEVICDRPGCVREVNEELQDHYPHGVWVGRWSAHSEELGELDLCMGCLIEFMTWWGKRD